MTPHAIRQIAVFVIAVVLARGGRLAEVEVAVVAAPGDDIVVGVGPLATPAVHALRRLRVLIVAFTLDRR